MLQRERDAPEKVTVAEFAARPCPYRRLDDDWVIRAAAWKIATLTAMTGVLAAAAMFLLP